MSPRIKCRNTSVLTQATIKYKHVFVIDVDIEDSRDLLTQSLPEIQRLLSCPDSNREIINSFFSTGLVDSLPINRYVEGIFRTESEKMTKFLWMVLQWENKVIFEFLTILINLPIGLEKTSSNIRDILGKRCSIKCEPHILEKRRSSLIRSNSAKNVNTFRNQEKENCIWLKGDKLAKSKKLHRSSKENIRQYFKQLSKSSEQIIASDAQYVLVKIPKRKVDMTHSNNSIHNEVKYAEDDQISEITPLLDDQMQNPQTADNRKPACIPMDGDTVTIENIPEIVICEVNRNILFRAWNSIKGQVQIIWNRHKVKLITLFPLVSGAIIVTVYVGLKCYQYELNGDSNEIGLTDFTQDNLQTTNQFTPLPCIIGVPADDGSGVFRFSLTHKVMPC